MGHDEPVSIAESKAQVRAEIRSARGARSEAERAGAGAAIAGHVLSLLPATGGSLTAYLSMPTEPPTDALIEGAWSAGHRLLVPRITGRDLAWIPLQPDTVLARGPLGIREPVGDPVAGEALTLLDLLVLPGLAVDAQGIRLGQGGGFYDAALAAVPAHADGGPMRVIVLFDEEVRAQVPHEPHDCRVDAAVTPSGIRRFA